MWMDSLFWLIAAAVFAGVEAATTALVSVWFAVGAAVALIVSLFPVTFTIQVAVFAVVSAITLGIMVPRLAKRRAAQKPPVTNGAELVLGKQGIVLQAVEPGMPGRVRVDGLDWQARAETSLPAGSKCQVEATEGAVLVVSAVREPSNAVK